MIVDGKSHLVLPGKNRGRDLALWLAILLIGGAMALIRITAPSDLMDHEQQRQAAYVMDAIQNHHWIIQKDEAGEIASKPPLFTWLAIVPTLILGRPEPFAMRSIALLSTLGTAFLLAWMSRRFYGNRAAVLTALAYLVSSPVSRQIWMGRMDSLLPLAITCGAVAAWMAWQEGKSWVWFWLAISAGMLTKGPIGLFCAAGLVAAVFEPRSTKRAGRARGTFLGIGLFVLISGGWLALACHAMGTTPVIHKLMIEELLKQTVSTNKHRFLGSRFWEPPMYFTERFVPWSIFAVLALWRICRLRERLRRLRRAMSMEWRAGVACIFGRIPDDRSPGDQMIARFERFVACWLLFSMLPMCLLTHQRGDLALPLYPAGALLVGRQLARLLERWSNAATFFLLGPIAAICYCFLIYDWHYNLKDASRQTRAVAELAATIRERIGENYPLTCVDGPFALDVDLNTMRPLYFTAATRGTGVRDVNRVATYDYAAAGQLLSSKECVVLVVFNVDYVRKFLSDAKTPVYDLAQSNLPGVSTLHLISNRPALAPMPDVAMGIGPLKLVSHDLTWLHAAASDFTVSGGGTLAITNNDSIPQTIHVRHGYARIEATISPGEIWSVQWTEPTQPPVR